MTEHAWGFIRLPALVLAFLLAGTALRAQARPETAGEVPLFLVNSQTGVASVAFRFPEGGLVEVDQLRAQISLSSPGLGTRLRAWFDFLPLFPPPRYEDFSPPELLRDVARLERFYREAGFRDPSVEYRVALDTVTNLVEVVFLVDEGTPILMERIEVRGPGGDLLGESLPEELLPAWPRLLERLRRSRGERLSRSLRLRLQDDVGNWLRNRGYPFPEVTDTVTGAESGAGLAILVDPGRRLRVGALQVTGNAELSSEILRREIPIHPGDWYSRARVASGQSELFGLDMVRMATTEAVRREEDDRVDVRVSIDEGRPRLVSGRIGVTEQSGVSGDASWSHRNFLGGARVLEVSALARTGVLAPQSDKVRRYGLSVLLDQPYLFHRRVEGLLRPFSEYRSDKRDRSVEAGTEVSAVYRRGPGRHVTLRYSISTRWVLEAGPAVPLGERGSLADLLQALDTLDLDRRTSTLGIIGQWGRGTLGPEGRRGWGVYGLAEVAGPPGLSTVEYGKLVGEVSGEYQLTPWLTVSGRTGGGRVLPFGASVPGDDEADRLETYLELRDVIFTAGGAYDVRGWADGMMGPKIPDFRGGESEAETIRAPSYLPLGGTARWTGSLQLNFPLPVLSHPHGLHLFLDAGRIWIPDRRLLPPGGILFPGQRGNRVRFGTGIGILVSTPVGPLQVDLGYKVNPSVLDIRNPGAVAEALAADTPVEDVPTDPWLRWQLHVSIGRMR